MVSSFILFISLFLPVALCIFFIYMQKSDARLPPGPHPFPIIGSLHLLSPLPHHDVRKLSRKYGPIFHLRLGSIPTIFISSPSLVEQLFKSHDIAISNHPPSEASKIIFYGNKGFAFSEYGPYWRKIRKICVNNFSTPAKLDLFEFIRKQEMAIFVQFLKEAAEAQVTVDVTAMVRLVVAGMVFRTMMGRKYVDESSSKFSEQIGEALRILGSFSLNDAVPLLRMFDLQGMRRRIGALKEKIDVFMETVIDEHVRLKKEGSKKEKYFVDVLLDHMDATELELDLTAVKAVTLEMLMGSLETPPNTIDWALVELLRHPKSMTKAQEEIARIVGPRRAVEESDLPELPYLAMVIKESLRLHQTVPFLFRYTKENIIIDGYNIPKGSSVMVCTWAMARDPNLWHNADEFIPERFENSSIDVNGRDFQFLPFGSGRRSCPGMSFGVLAVRLVLANLLHCFDWKLANGASPSELEMKERFGMSMSRAAHLHAIPGYRLVDI